MSCHSMFAFNMFGHVIYSMKNNESIEHIFMQITNFGVLTIKLSSEAYKYNDSVIMKLSY